MLGKQAIKRLLNEVALHKNDYDPDKFKGFLEDINLVCATVEIYRQLASQKYYWLSGDLSAHKQIDIEAKRMYKKLKGIKLS